MNSSNVIADKTMPGDPESTIDSLFASNELLTSLLQSLREIVGVEVTVPIKIESEFKFVVNISTTALGVRE